MALPPKATSQRGLFLRRFMKHSIIIPARNGGKWIQNAIRSALANKPDEVIVYDDNSTDDTLSRAKAISDPLLEVISNPGESSGIAASFQAAFDASQGEFVTIVGQDDMIDADYLERVAEAFKDDVGMVACHPRFIDADGAPYANASDQRLGIPKPINMSREEFLRIFRIGNMYFGINTYRRAAVVEAGGFDAKAGWLLDLDLYIRIVKKHEIRVIEDELCSLTLSTETTSYITSEKIPANEDEGDFCDAVLHVAATLALRRVDAIHLPHAHAGWDRLGIHAAKRRFLR